MQWKPNVTVAAIARQDDRFLLVEEDIAGQRVFNQPAGHLEEHETLTGAVVREVLEESAWRFRPEFLTGIYLYPNKLNGITYLRFCFYGECSGHEGTRELDSGIIRTAWLTLKEIESRKTCMRSPMVLESLYDYLGGKKYPLDVLRHFPPTAPECILPE